MSRPLCIVLSAAITALLPAFTTKAADAAPLFSSKIVHLDTVPIHLDLSGAKELYLVVGDAGDGFGADWADWMEPTLTLANGGKVRLTELKPKKSSVGWGSLQVDARPDGKKPMRVAGQDVPFGFGAHAPSLIAFDLPEGVASFDAKGGVDEGGVSQGSGATVVFKVYTSAPPASVLAAKESTQDKPYGLEAARDDMAKFKTPAGLAVGLFAAEPQIQNPTNIDVDDRGRVWAVEAVNYRKWDNLRPEGDRVVILEDTKGVGSADKATTFWQASELKWPLGICVLPQRGNGRVGTKVIVSAAPNVWLLEDTKGDDHADKVTKLFTTGGNPNHDHNIHAFSFGPDGKLYFNMGNEAQKLMWPDGTPVRDVAGNDVTNVGKPYRQGMVFRCDLDSETGKVSNIETLAWNFRNNYEVCVDSFGTLWQSDNDDDGNKGVRINYVMECGNYGFTDEMTGAGWSSKRTNLETEIPLRHWHQNDPGVIPNLLQTGGGSPTGILVNEGTLLGAEFANQMIHCDAGPRVVRSYPVTNYGAGYKASIVNVLESGEDWYRPADLCMAPDGSLIVADWFDGVVGGHNMTDHEANSIRGRIYRVAPDLSKYHTPSAAISTPEEAVATLQSPNKATQYVAWQKLHSLGAAAEPALAALWRNENPRFRARALQLLARIPGRADFYVNAALSDANPDIRIAGLRVGRELYSAQPELDLAKSHETAGRMIANETNPQVNRELAIALTVIKERSDAAAPWTKLALKYQGNDRWYLEALGIGARGVEDACFAAWLQAVGNWNTTAGRDIVWRLRSADTAEYLAKILVDPATSASEAPRYLREFDFLPDGAKKTKALEQLVGLATQNKMVALEALQRLKNVDLSGHAEVQKAIASLLESSRGTAQFVELVRDFKLTGQGDGLLEIALKSPSNPEGVEATKMLLAPNYTSTLTKALETPAALTVVEALGNTADQRSAPLLESIVTNEAKDASLRKQAVKSLAQSPAGVAVLLKLARDGVFPQALKLTATSALTGVQLPQQKAEIAQLFPRTNGLNGETLPTIGELAKRTGNAEHGKALFAREETTCITCHRVGAVGVDFAPALSEIGTKLNKEALYEAIIDPNAGITMGFETTVLTLKDGGAAVGIVRSETADEVVLAMPKGVLNPYKKADITNREKLKTSMMPPGLQQILPTNDLVDLVEYLASLKAPAK